MSERFLSVRLVSYGVLRCLRVVKGVVECVYERFTALLWFKTFSLRVKVSRGFLGCPVVFYTVQYVFIYALRCSTFSKRCLFKAF